MSRFFAVAVLLLMLSCEKERTVLPDSDISFEFPEYARYFELEMPLHDPAFGVTVPERCSSWLRAEASSDGSGDATIRFQMKENLTDSGREAIVMVGDSISVSIHQTGAGMKGALRKGLTALYNALDGEHWSENYGWESGMSVMEWYGVEPSSSVVADLFGEKETVYYGTSDEWRLNLDDNRLRGIVPDGFWEACHHFSEISMRGAELEGTVLSDRLWHDGLRRVCFRDTGIEGKLTDAIANAPGLETVDFQSCKLSGSLPENLGSLSGLTELKLGANFGLSGTLHDSFYDLSSLEWFSIGCTRIGGVLSREIGRLKNLRYFCISFCEFEGRIPEELGMIPGIGVLCEGNYFTELPEFIRYRGFQNEWIVTGGITPDWVPFFQRDRKDGRPEDLYSMGQYGIVYNYDYCHLLPLPLWARIRYGLLRWDMFHSYEDLISPEYPSADDLQYPADEYYYDGEHWRHPALEYPAGEYYFDGSEWLHDASCPWDKEYEPAKEDTGTW